MKSELLGYLGNERMESRETSGSGFQPGETVELQGLLTDLPENSGSEHVPWLVTNGASGNFTTTWYVACEILNVNIKLAKKT